MKRFKWILNYSFLLLAAGTMLLPGCESDFENELPSERETGKVGFSFTLPTVLVQELIDTALLKTFSIKWN